MSYDPTCQSLLSLLLLPLSSSPTSLSSPTPHARRRWPELALPLAPPILLPRAGDGGASAPARGPPLLRSWPSGQISCRRQGLLTRASGPSSGSRAGITRRRRLKQGLTVWRRFGMAELMLAVWRAHPRGQAVARVLESRGSGGSHRVAAAQAGAHGAAAARAGGARARRARCSPSGQAMGHAAIERAQAGVEGVAPLPLPVNPSSTRPAARTHAAACAAGRAPPHAGGTRPCGSWMLACCGPERQLNGGSAQERQRAAEQGCDDNRQCVRARAAEQGRNGGCAQDWGSARRRLHARLGRRGAAALRGSAREKMARGRQRAGAQESAQER
ncbi:hypothetical protein PVAP13_6KG089505 [Panicum virgatum]|uniref:Uncharacterized protein n=1 Tax=Panicum virgatum TaxID=38727 RepID=A0A8T0RA58_PANVG|nr:hypothetical protein PVAP13_6KG089505 [Panicum virgatum]